MAGHVGVLAAVAHDRHLRQRRKSRVECLPPQPEAFQRRRTVRGQQQVGIGQQRVQLGPSCRVLQVQGHHSLPGRQPLVVVGCGETQHVPRRRLHLRHRGTQRHQPPCGSRPRQVPRQADDLDTLQRQRCHQAAPVVVVSGRNAAPTMATAKAPTMISHTVFHRRSGISGSASGRENSSFSSAASISQLAW